MHTCSYIYIHRAGDNMEDFYASLQTQYADLRHPDGTPFTSAELRAEFRRKRAAEVREQQKPIGQFDPDAYDPGMLEYFKKLQAHIRR
jgi:hypothetical protein